jgi:AcrR family transcriptional regulator
VDPFPHARAGRPRGSSREMLQEAASELFLEQSYARTTIEQITQRAGVSRNTFFNYFPAKSDLLWVEVDERLADLPRALESARLHAPTREATDAVRQAILEVAAGFGPGRVPLAMTQSDLMGTTGELETSALSRFTVAAGLLSGFVARRLAVDADSLICRAFAMAVLAAAAAAAIEWAQAGVTRGPLGPYVDTAISPVCDGYRARF